MSCASENQVKKFYLQQNVLETRTENNGHLLFNFNHVTLFSALFTFLMTLLNVLFLCDMLMLDFYHKEKAIFDSMETDLKL